MPVNADRIRQCLQAFDFKKLFIQELGWDKHSANLPVAVNGTTFKLQAIAEKRGMQVFEYAAPSAAGFPVYDVRRKIERQVAKLAHEHIIIYTDAGKTQQKWQWVRREPGRPLACREPGFEKGQTGEALVQKLQVLAVDLEEEESLSLVDVTRRARQAFDVDRVTKRFYDRFKTEHINFLKFIKGVTETGDREWYASLMLNRLMFIYFIQKKGFLDGDLAYLRNRMRTVQEQKGKDKFHTFYRYFLLRLFHEGLGQPKQDRMKDLDALLGEVPYLNGGLFDVHELEHANPAIEIADIAFEHLFNFFDEYEWHLDDRPLRNDKEINPDVLGYIFEKYINQKQMGAYYTKEDITGYIARNTIIPFLFNAAEKKCAIAFRPESAVWRLLRDDPNRYLYSAVGHSIFCDANQKPPRSLAAALTLPSAVAEGVADVAKRKGWNRPATPEYALPTETWREVVTRRQRCQELQKKLKAGEIHTVNDLITYNLDICQFTEDVIENCESPELLRAFWKAIESVSVLDPTCGSGAFLFAALNILEPLYEACLARMHAFMEDLARSGEKRHPEKFGDFRKTLEDVATHPNHHYFVLKSIIINNLYGVDIMEEAVEICKLRLFLTLVAQVDAVKHLEPLPDIDFNIRSGNTLVGFASLDDVQKTVEGGTFAFTKEDVDRIVEDADIVNRKYTMFRRQQTELGGVVTSRDKADLRSGLTTLSTNLDRYLAGEYGVSVETEEEFKHWQESYQPFHWFAEFYGIMHNGGFDVIIGNPPYVELSDIKDQYRIQGLSLLRTGNLFSICAERFVNLACPRARLGIITPISAISTPRMLPLMGYLSTRLSPFYVCNFAVRPGKLFCGVDMNLSILLGKVQSATKNHSPLLSTGYNRWQGEYRPFLFPTLSYANSMLIPDLSCVPKLRTELETALFAKLRQFPRLADLRVDKGRTDIIYYHSGGRYFRKCLQDRLSKEYKALEVKATWGRPLICVLSSSLYYWFWLCISDCYHVTKRDVEAIPIAMSIGDDETLPTLADKLLQDLWKHAEVRNRRRADGNYVEETNFDVSQSKHILDDIDRTLATHYGLSSEELDFLITYDAKFRESGSDD